MQNQFVITIDSRVTPDFALIFLKNVNFIKTIKQRRGKGIEKPSVEEVNLMAEKSLSEE